MHPDVLRVIDLSSDIAPQQIIHNSEALTGGYGIVSTVQRYLHYKHASAKVESRAAAVQAIQRHKACAEH